MGFNILGPLQNQIDAMGDSKKGVAAGLGLTAASLLAAQSAEAAQQVADLAAGDNRFGTIALLALPVVGWVLFNILGERRRHAGPACLACVVCTHVLPLAPCNSNACQVWRR